MLADKWNRDRIYCELLATKGSELLIDVENAIIVDVEATTAIWQAAVLAAKRLIERSLERFDLYPNRLLGGSGNGSAEVALRCGSRLLCQFAGLSGRHGGFQRGALLGSGAHGAWPSGATDQPSVRDAIRQVEQERPERCGCDLRSGRPAVHALRATKINRSAGGASRPSHSPPLGRRPGQTRQPGSRSSVRAWDCHCP